MARTSKLATYERLMRALADAQKAVEEAENAMVAFEGDAGPFPGFDPLDGPMKRRETAIRAIVYAIEEC